jgi:hypothetical protein
MYNCCADMRKSKLTVTGGVNMLRRCTALAESLPTATGGVHLGNMVFDGAAVVVCSR